MVGPGRQPCAPRFVLLLVGSLALLAQSCVPGSAVALGDSDSTGGESGMSARTQGQARELPPPWTRTPDPRPSAAPPRRQAPVRTATPQPFMTGPEVIGTSLGGLPLEVYRFGWGPVKRMIVAGIHGGYEWNTIALAEELIDYLAEHPEMIPPEISLFILPAINPDGEERSHGYAGRANENGVDLNRNWPAHWKEVWAPAGCWNYLPISGGPEPASEPEVKALLTFVLSQRIEAVISYHSAALGIFPGGQPPTGYSLHLAEAIAEVTPYPYPPRETGCEYTGQFSDWAAENGIPAVDVELSNHYETDFEVNLRVLQVFLAWQPPH